jgi:hypothetical protein
VTGPVTGAPGPAVVGPPPKPGSTLTKAAALRITLNIDGTPITSRTHSPITLANISSINLVSIFRCYPNDIGRSLNEDADDKIRKYRTDYNNNPPNAISFMSSIVCTSGRLHSEFVCLLFLQAHRETDRFFAPSGVELP